MDDKIVVIENERLEVQLCLRGGAFYSIRDKSDRSEVMWQGESRAWRGRDVLLFPFCGRQVGKYYLHRGKKYKSSLHGFAKDSVFTVAESTSTRIALELESSPLTLQVYPFDFVLRVEYSLEGNTISVNYTVTNKGGETMYFGLGSHLGIKLDAEKAGFFREETAGNFITLGRAADSHFPLKDGTGFVLSEEKLPEPLTRFELRKSLFVKYPTLLLHTGGGSLTLERKNGKSLTFDYGAPVLALWSHHRRGAFVCVEPWWGLPDEGTPKRELADKVMINSLEPGKDFEAGYRITVGK